MGKTGKVTQTPMVFRKLRINEIEEAFYNPRKVMKKGSKKYNNLKNSLEKFGYVEPLVVNEVNNRLISGHQRLNVLHDLGQEEVEVSIVHIEDEAHEKALNIALNKIKGKWDTRKLADVLNSIGDEFDALDLGFEESDIAAFLKSDEDLGVSSDHADAMDANTEIKNTPATCTVAIGGVRFQITAEEFHQMEQSIIEAGYFSDKEIGEEITRRFIAQ